jgi:hypothetical protein
MQQMPCKRAGEICGLKMATMVDDGCERLFSRFSTVGWFVHRNQCAAIVTGAELLGEHSFEIDCDHPHVHSVVNVAGVDNVVQPLRNVVLASLRMGSRCLRSSQARALEVSRPGQAAGVSRTIPRPDFEDGQFAVDHGDKIP